jgi:general secretion pathway protein K
MKPNLNLAFPPSRIAHERGAALIVVLWILIFMAVVAFDFSAAVREDGTMTHRYSDEVQGYYLAVAGFERGLYDLLSQPSGRVIQQDQQRSDLFDGNWREENLGAGIFRVRLVDEGGKIAINRVDEITLHRILTNLGVEENQKNILVDSIMDWRDPDDLHRTNGAENEYYLSLSPSYTAKNGPFDSVEDLLWVRGMTSTLFFGATAGEEGQGAKTQQIGLREIFTVDSPTDRVNLRTASAAVIHALMGIPLEKTRAFVEERKKLGDKTLADMLSLLGIGAGEAAIQKFIFTNPSIVAVVAEGQPTDSRLPRRVKGIVRVGSGQQGFELQRWIDRDIALPEG